MKKGIFLVWIQFCLCFFSTAQEFSCGTTLSQEVIMANQMAVLRGPKPTSTFEAGSTVPDTCIRREITVTIHVVRDSMGNYGITQQQINNGMLELNNDFKPMCLSFRICKIDTIKNWKYDIYDQLTEENEMLTLYYNPKTINIYLVKSIKMGGSSVCGYAPLPSPGEDGTRRDDFIFLGKNCIPGKPLSHEMGHYFNLFHTFETQFGNELANKSNCATTGDLVCDTEADVNPTLFAPGTCKYVGTTKDAMGNYLLPPIGNIMSYHAISCKCPFTTQQFNRMANAYFLYRKYLY